ncbi:hypothetical protein C0995_007312 [Termitomyces sp. Mi166|nr:hypothetical protein C0995_007312 [Termitomyces sp. Mi166\
MSSNLYQRLATSDRDEPVSPPVHEHELEDARPRPPMFPVDPRFEQPTPSPWARAALLIFTRSVWEAPLQVGLGYLNDLILMGRNCRSFFQMPPILRSATRSQSAKVVGATVTTDSGRLVKSRGGRSRSTKRDELCKANADCLGTLVEQNPAPSRDNHNQPAHLSSKPTPEAQSLTSDANGGTCAHYPNTHSSHQISETVSAARPTKTLSAEERIQLKQAAQTEYLKRWGNLLGQNFDYDEATEWEESFTIDVLDELGRGGDKEGSRKTSGKDGDGNQEEGRQKRQGAVVKKYLKKWDDMLGVSYDWPECDELFKEFEEWMRGMEGILDELTS